MKKITLSTSQTLFWVTISYFFTAVYIAYGQGFSSPSSNCGGTEGGLSNPLRSICSFEDFVALLLQAVIRIGLPIAALFIVYSGFLFVKAQGNVTELQKAKDTFFYTIIGVTIFLGSWAIALIVQNTIKLLTG